MTPFYVKNPNTVVQWLKENFFSDGKMMEGAELHGLYAHQVDDEKYCIELDCSNNVYVMTKMVWSIGDAS